MSKINHLVSTYLYKFLAPLSGTNESLVAVLEIFLYKFLVLLPRIVKVVFGNSVSKFGILDMVLTSFWRRCRGLKQEFKYQYSNQRENC